MTLLRICDRQISQEAIDSFESELSTILAQIKPQIEVTIRTIRDDDIAGTIVRIAYSFDLVVLRSMRRRTAGGLAVSDVTTQVLSELTCSMVLFGEPNSITGV